MYLDRLEIDAQYMVVRIAMLLIADGQLMALSPAMTVLAHVASAAGCMAATRARCLDASGRQTNLSLNLINSALLVGDAGPT
mmetsp:Transcript_129718/g.258785  ORF Transcript_129718/g.258785 Transcript_129718/m.258785 type:complete len:82 (+) Transcript_129718:34-279(+)